MVVKWQFYDSVGPSTYTYEINPNEGGSPARKKTITYQNTAAPNGKTLIYEGRDEVETISFSGVLLSEDQYNAFTTWYEKRRQVRVTDDLGRQFWIYITRFEPQRVRSYMYPWKHTYQVDATILDWPA